MTQEVNVKENKYICFPTVTNTPTNIVSVRTGLYTVELSWSAPASNIPPVVGYEVFYAESGSNVTQSVGIITNTTTISVTLPTLYVVYDLFAVAFSDASNSLPSAHSSNSTIDLGEPGLVSMKNFSLILWLWCDDINHLKT